MNGKVLRKTIKQSEKEVVIEYFYTEVSSKNVDKWYAIEVLADKLSIRKEEIIAIGDNINDKKMIEEAGLGIVMKNSTKDVINIADYITKKNSKDGVAKAIKKFCK